MNATSITSEMINAHTYDYWTTDDMLKIALAQGEFTENTEFWMQFHVINVLGTPVE